MEYEQIRNRTINKFTKKMKIKQNVNFFFNPIK